MNLLSAEKKRKQFVSSVHIERNSSVSRTQRHIRTVMHLAAGFGVGCAAAYSAGKNYTYENLMKKSSGAAISIFRIGKPVVKRQSEKKILNVCLPRCGTGWQEIMRKY